MRSRFQDWFQAREIEQQLAGNGAGWKLAESGPAGVVPAVGVPRACYLAHIRAQTENREAYFVRMAGRVVEMRRTMPPVGSGKRGKIRGWSPRSRARMVKAFEAVDWQPLQPLVFAALTYPAEFPTDGRVVKDHLAKFRYRWRKSYGQPQGAWKLEFQDRGAPHIHLLLKQPDLDLVSVRQWIAEAWSEIVAAADQEKHKRVGTSCGLWRSERSPGRYFAKYGTKFDKARQNETPPDFEAPGRFWGLWGIRPDWQQVEVTREAWIKANRILRKYRIRRGKIKASRSSMQGRWVAGGLRSGDLARGILSTLEAALQAQVTAAE